LKKLSNYVVRGGGKRGGRGGRKGGPLTSRFDRRLLEKVSKLCFIDHGGPPIEKRKNKKKKKEEKNYYVNKPCPL